MLAGSPRGVELGLGSPWAPSWAGGHPGRVVTGKKPGASPRRGGRGKDRTLPKSRTPTGRHPSWGGLYRELSWPRRISPSPRPERCAWTRAERGGQAAGWTHSPRAIGGSGLSDPASALEPGSLGGQLEMTALPARVVLPKNVQNGKEASVAARGPPCLGSPLPNLTPGPSLILSWPGSPCPLGESAASHGPDCGISACLEGSPRQRRPA
ncbi:uncharacterized protein [Macaca nemestrina]|uniref:uncharacterized protein n=1 Tax=Macaca nemestrina TaxID=9545 RepID=UPI0039B9B9D3